MEIEGRELGERKCNRHRPRWRKEMEEREKNLLEASNGYQMEQGYSEQAAAHGNISGSSDRQNNSTGDAVQAHIVSQQTNTANNDSDKNKSSKWRPKQEAGKKLDMFSAFDE